MKTNDPQPVVIPPNSGKVLKFLGITHKLTLNKLTAGIIFLNLSLIPKAETVSMCIATKMKLSMFWRVPSRSGLAIKN